MSDVYPIDDDMKTMLTEVLSMAQRVIDLQYDDDIAEELEELLVSVAERFDIQTTKMTVDVSEDGKTFTVTHDEALEELDTFKGWTPTVIEGDKPESTN